MEKFGLGESRKEAEEVMTAEQSALKAQRLARFGEVDPEDLKHKTHFKKRTAKFEGKRQQGHQ